MPDLAQAIEIPTSSKQISAYAGPHLLGGIGFTQGYVKQGAERVCHLIKHLWWGYDLGTVMMCVLVSYNCYPVRESACWKILFL